LWFVFVGPNFVVLSFGHVPASRNLAECLNGHSRSPSTPDPNKVTYTVSRLRVAGARVWTLPVSCVALARPLH
ncbi:hypothetical protein B0H10DRAFT_1976765, partial [Mycena sp. CBHHK59/15]